ncbi:hypothetical protein MKEN_01269900 [Mycena kentingensis (nom. inval.)]|nr:hypothetical protein MKEN_01269900 [Mycena kentingensis (nom. inval.)]
MPIVKANAAMDGVYSILTGLVLRLVVDAATFHNVKLAGTLIGFWEGCALLVYSTRAPKSSDPYLAYTVRLFVDFLVTESVFKLMIVLLWTTLGMIVADTAPSVWVEYGLRKRWSKFRRDLYWTIRTFTRKRRSTTVRFVAAPTVASAASDVGSVVDSTVVTAAPPPSSVVSESVAPRSITTTTSRPTTARRNSVPGMFPGAEWSETDTDVGSRVGTRVATSTLGSVLPSESHYTSPPPSESRYTSAPPSESRYASESAYPSTSRYTETTFQSESGFPSESGFQSESAFSPQSSHVTIARFIPVVEPSEDSYTYSTRSSSPTYSLEYSDDPSASNPLDIPSEVEPDEEEDDQMFVHVGVGRRDIPIMDELQTTPKQVPLVLPPTPSDTMRDLESSHEFELEPEIPPPSPAMPLIPDQELEDWETVNADEAEAPPVPPKEVPPTPLSEPAESSSPPKEESGSDTASVDAPSTIGPLLPSVTTNEAPKADAPPSPAEEVDAPPPPAEESASVPEPAVPEEPQPPAEEPMNPPPADEAPAIPLLNLDIPLDVPPPPPIVLDDQAARTPPPSFEDIYGEDIEAPKVDAEEEGEPPAPNPDVDTVPEVAPTESDPAPPAESPVSSPSASVRQALSLRREAIELTARIASLSRKRMTSLAENSAQAISAAMLAKIEMEETEKELAELNAKAEGAFDAASSQPPASLYEFNTTGLTPEETVAQVETRLEQLLLTPVPPAGTTPEDLAHDSPNRAGLKVTMETSIKGRLVKNQLLNALNENGLNWTEDASKPNVVFIQLPIMPEAEPETPTTNEPAGAGGDDEKAPADEKQNEDDPDDAKEY